MKVTPESDNEFDLELNDKDLEHVQAICRKLQRTPSETLQLFFEHAISNWLIHEPYDSRGSERCHLSNL